ncbi:hypothetical protein [Candidatus Poriferisodalis sp.]|uniref:hypothetical protein n=1 Tax=Candidatus Poriferisodalis sp. TaxID=3101277 RepID=UPI003B01D67A
MSAAASQNPAEVKRRAAAMLANGASVRALARDLGIGRERATSLAKEIEVEAEHARAAGHGRAMDALRETFAEANDAADELQEFAAEATDLGTRLAIARERRLSRAQRSQVAARLAAAELAAERAERDTNEYARRDAGRDAGHDARAAEAEHWRCSPSTAGRPIGPHHSRPVPQHSAALGLPTAAPYLLRDTMQPEGKRMTENRKPTASKPWTWNTRPRDVREFLAYAAMLVAVLAWMVLAEPLGKWQATIGMVVTVAVCMPVYGSWCRRRSPSAALGKTD